MMGEPQTAWFVTSPGGRAIAWTGEPERNGARQLFLDEMGRIWREWEERGYDCREFRLVPVEKRKS